MIIDKNICDLRGLAITTENKQDYETPGIYIYIYMVTPPRVDSSSWGGDHHTTKTLQIPVKNASCMHMTLNILTFQKGKISNFLKPESGSEKGPINLQIVNPLNEKRT